MDSDALASLPASRAATLIADGTLSSVDLIEAWLARIAARDAEVHAWAHLDEAGARVAVRCERVLDFKLAIDVTEQALRKQRAR